MYLQDLSKHLRGAVHLANLWRHWKRNVTALSI